MGGDLDVEVDAVEQAPVQINCCLNDGVQLNVANARSLVVSRPSCRFSIDPPDYVPAVCDGTGEFRNSFLNHIFLFRLSRRNGIKHPDRLLG